MHISRHRQRINTFIWGMVILGSMVSAQLSGAATYYVATNGSDANGGTEQEPFRTLSRAVSVLRPGDTLYVKKGTYTGSSQLSRIPSGTSWSAPVTVAAYAGDRPVIIPEPGNHALVLVGNQYIIIDGFIIDGAGGLDGVKITYSSSGSLAHHIRIQNSEIKNAPGQGLLIAGNNNEFIDLRVHDNGTNGFSHGIYILSSNNLIEGCEIYNNAAWGVHIYSSSGDGANNNIVRSNEIHHNARAGKGGPGILLSSGTENTAYDNEVWGNKGGIQIDYYASNTSVHDNTIYDNSSYGILIGQKSVNATIENNSIDDQPAISNQGVGTVIRQ
jgi:parallel beta-helix repeat protein